ncbi:carboxylesterase [Botrytis cinerea]
MPPFFSALKEISEDCLHLHIARPSGLNLNSNSNLPVVVYNAEGGVIKGSNHDDHISPDKLISLSVDDGNPIVFVALNSRLSIFGFPRLPLLKEEKSLNLGMRDQRAAFEWVRDHIQEFGGDPNRITAYGLSAGGTMTSLQVMAYGGQKGVPFQQAWVMSGPPGTSLNMTSDVTEHHTRAVADKVGCGGLVDSEILSCLQDIPMQDLIDSAMEYSVSNHPPSGLFTFIPSVDDDFLPDRYSTMMREGSFVKGIDMVFGWTQDDGAMNVGPGHLIQSEEDMITSIKSFIHAMTTEQYAKLFDLYSASDFEEELNNYVLQKDSEDPDISVHYFRVSRILRDVLFTCSSIDFGYHMVKWTQQTIDPTFTGVRLYDLNQSALTPLWKGAGMPYVKVSHGSDNNYLFNGVFPEGQLTEEDNEMSEMMARSLINFAHTGNPISQTISRKQFDEWPELYDKIETENTPLENFKIQVIGGPLGTGPVILTDGDDQDGNERKLENENIGIRQQVLSGADEFGSMGSRENSERKRLIEQEKLFQRCKYINSLADTLDV